MKLLYDHNLSPRLVTLLADIFPNSSHTSLLGLDTATDREVWDFARDNGYTIVSKDADFIELNLLLGFPPRILLLRIGNRTTAALATLLRTQQADIEDFHSDPLAGILTLS